VIPPGFKIVFRRVVQYRYGAGQHLPDVIKGTADGVSWGCGDGEVYYSTQDDAHRPDKVWRHALVGLYKLNSLYP
jgi:protease II